MTTSEANGRTHRYHALFADFVKHSPSRLIDPRLDSGNDAVAFSERTRDDFDWGVGSDESLRDAVQQAKIAVSYPPHGMHVLLLTLLVQG